MKRDDDPERLLSSSSPEDARLRALLQAGRDELPTAGELASLATKLGPILGPGPGGGGGGGGGAAASGMSGATMAKVAAVVVGSVVVGVTAWHMGRVEPADRAAVASAPTTVQPAPTTRADVPASLPEPSTEAPSSSAAPAPSTSPSAHARSQASSAAPAEDPDREVALLQHAQDALAVDPSRALSICAEHSRGFPHGLLAQEREVIAVDALVRLGRLEDAQQRAARFAAAYPSSTHLRRIEALVGKGP